ncbi:MAG TPA: sugar isomerase domain-containing protein [Nocardioidaceae bacterium]|nr:sugar isomerase domain-containing protein [Nocardioidaceae bacterium]
MQTERLPALAGTVRELLDVVDHANREALPRAADLVLECLRRDGLVHVAASGHSLAMVCEAFYRAGGLAAVRPLWWPEMFPLSDAQRSTVAERTPGLAQQAVDEAAPQPSDVTVVFSTTGRNPYPVEVAAACKARGVPVVAVTSPHAARAAEARHPSTLVEHADVVLDSAVPPGDAAYPDDEPRTSAVSTITAAYVWSMLLAELDDRASQQGFDLPRWRSANVPGGDAANADLFARYGPRIQELGVDR